MSEPIDLERISRRIANWRASGQQPMRIWLTSSDWIVFLHACGLGHRASAVRRLVFAGVPITVMDVTASRLVFADGFALSWSKVCGG